MVAMTTVTGSKQMISIQPDELKFIIELDKQSFCDLKVTNNTDQNVAFKVKTTSPKKYFVRPNTGVIHPWDSCVIRVSLQAQREYPLDMNCKDKFLLQSTVVSANTEVEDLPQDTFTKDSGKVLEECKLRVVYASPNSAQGTDNDSASSAARGLNAHGNLSSEDALKRVKEEKDAAVRQTQQLQQELEMLKKHKLNNSSGGFSFKFVILVAIIGILLGFLSKALLSSPPTRSS